MGCLKSLVFLSGIPLLFCGPLGILLGLIAMISVFIPGQYKR